MHIWTEAMPEAIEERKWRSIYVITLCDQLNTGRKAMKQTDQITKYVYVWVCVCVCAPHIYLLGLYYVLSTVLTVLHIWTVFVLPETLKNNNNFIPIFSNVARKIKKSLSILCKVHSSNKQRRQDTEGERVWRGCVLSEIRKIRLEFISLIVGRYLSKEVW